MKPTGLFLMTLLVGASIEGATFTVTNTADSGAGSLRQAILDANASPGLDTIAFDIPGGGVHTMTPSSDFAQITDAVVIDGYTQPGSSVNTDPIGSNAVLLIEIDGTGVTSNFPLNINSASPTTVRGLVMNGWNAVAIQTAGSSVGAVITGNFIGTNPSGTTVRGNNQGVHITGVGTTVGGATPADRNLISGNSFGIYVLAVSATIQGNLIGTDATGTLPLANTDTGIVCAQSNGTGTKIGGSGPGEGNVISGNSRGIWISQGGTINVVQGNKIGTTADGSGPLGNSDGIFTYVGGDDSVIGGVGPGEPNVIAYNHGQGIYFTSNGGSKNSARGNVIHDNGNLGIDLGNPGPNFNDALDADNGANTLQNFPILQSVEHLGPQGDQSTHILGKFNSTPSTEFVLDFYSNPPCAKFPREFLEGEVYLGSSQVTTDVDGHAAIDVTLLVGTDPAARVSATATDPAGNTSEFSQRIIFSVSPASGPAAGGTLIDVRGTDFADPTTLTFGITPGTVIFANDQQFSAISPALAPGTVHNLVATTPDGTVGTLVNGWVSDFLDVPGTHQFYSFVTTLVSNGITVGVGQGLYGVDQPTLRQQMAVFLMKALHGLCYVPPPCTTPVFTDVPCSLSFAPWINELVAEGITGGCGNGTTYCPADPVKRQQMAVLLLKTLGGVSYTPPVCVTPTFDDVPCDSPFATWIYDLVARGITGGCGNGNYCPTVAATRGQMAVFVTKTFNLQ